MAARLFLFFNLFAGAQIFSRFRNNVDVDDALLLDEHVLSPFCLLVGVYDFDVLGARLHVPRDISLFQSWRNYYRLLVFLLLFRLIFIASFDALFFLIILFVGIFPALSRGIFLGPPRWLVIGQHIFARFLNARA